MTKLDMKDWQEDHLRVGRVKDAHGIKGELFISLQASQADWLAQMDQLLLRKTMSPDLESLKIEEVRPHKNGLIIKPVQLSDRNAAEMFKGAEVYIPRSYVTAAPGERLYLQQFLGLTLVLKDHGPVGSVVGLSSNGPQDLLMIKTTKGEFAVPLVNEFLREIRLESRELEMDPPEGLIEF